MRDGFWHIEKIANRESLWVDRESEATPMILFVRDPSDESSQRLDTVTSILIWELGLIDIEEITATNVDEVFIRVRMLEYAVGPFMKTDEDGHFEPCLITFDDIRRRIGLRNRATGGRSFEEGIANWLRDRAERDLKRAKQDILA